MRFEAAAAGLVLGGLGVAAAMTLASGAAPPEAVQLRRYASVSRDAALSSALLEPARLFAALDAEASEELLGALDALAGAYERCRGGATSPLLLAEAMAARRRAAGALRRLVRLARQRRPMVASDLAEDVASLERYLDDCVHNVDQELGFQRAS